MPAGETRRVCVLIGYFDPVVAEHAVAIPADQYVIAAVDDPPDPLLDSRARLELTAGLSGIAQVVAGVPETFPADAIVTDIRQQHLDIRSRLMERVRTRAGGQ